jgi:hypothetical protein
VTKSAVVSETCDVGSVDPISETLPGSEDSAGEPLAAAAESTAVHAAAESTAVHAAAAESTAVHAATAEPAAMAATTAAAMAATAAATTAVRHRRRC